MPRRPTRTAPTVLLPGLSGSGPEHWQTWLAGELTKAGREVRTAAFPELDAPVLDDWLATLRSTLAGLPEDGFDVLAHSLSCLLWLHHTADTGGTPRPARVALVAPPAPQSPLVGCETFYPVRFDIDAVRKAADGTVLVGTDNDPYCPGGVARVYGAPLKMAATVISGGGHLNAEAGYGRWPAVLDWCGRDNLAFIA
jgi:predicted alpha/beta hydrolase family esterase